MNLRDARKKKKLDAFLTERDQHRTEDDASERFHKLTQAMALGKGRGKAKIKASNKAFGSFRKLKRYSNSCRYLFKCFCET